MPSIPKTGYDPAINKIPCYCNKCKLTKMGDNFYTYKDGTKMEICKTCLTMHLDNFDEDTYIWILEKLDYPYIPAMWEQIRTREASRNPNKPLGPLSVIGRYISTMKLRQWRKFNFQESDLAIEEKAKIDGVYMRPVNTENPVPSQSALDAAFAAGEISKGQYKTLSNPKSADDPLYYTPLPPEELVANATVGTTSFVDTLGDQLTAEDVSYLTIKWGRGYNPTEWVRLEESYENMCKSFDIRDADTIATLKLLCKTELKMNNAIDFGDIEGFQKLSRVYDSLRKSAKFTAAQNKEESNDSVDSIGQLIAMCEREKGFIPRLDLSLPQDKIDATIQDMKKYTHDLITDEMGLGKQIEEAALQIQLRQNEEDAEAAQEFKLDDEDFLQYFSNVDLDFDLDFGSESSEENGSS